MKKILCTLAAFCVILGFSPLARAEEAGEGMVVDAVSDSLAAGGSVYEYHIPQISLPGVDTSAVNEEIYRELYPYLESSQKEMAEYGVVSSSGGISYRWSQSGDILSLLVQNDLDPVHEYFVYNISLSTGTLVTPDSVTAQAGYSQNDYATALEQTVRNGYTEYSLSGGSFDEGMQTLTDECLARNLEQENLATAVPFIGPQGQLCAVLKMIVPYETGYTAALLDLESQKLFPYATWPAEENLSQTEALVTDTYTYVDADRECHVPMILLEGSTIESINGEIWEKLFRPEMETGGFNQELRGIKYTYAVNGDILSLCIDVDTGINDIHDFYVYNISVSELRLITEDELLEAVSVSRDEYSNLVKQGLEREWKARYANLGTADVLDDAFVQEQLRLSVADENAAFAVPYLNEKGELCVIGRLYPLAGAEWYAHKINLMNPDGALICFIENCDREKFNWEDIGGFSEEMCLYARNGIYARSGRQFQDPQLQNYFSQFDWYNPSIPVDQFTDAYLNDYQMQNLSLILSREEMM